MTAPAIRIEPAAWSAHREAVRAGWVLGLREIRTALRTPAYLIPNMIFFFFVLAAALDGVAAGSGVANFEGFLLPMAIIFAVQGGSAGLNMVADIESGYLDKLLATPAPRLAILLGAMSADFLRVMLQATLVVLVVLVGFAAGIDFATGVPGAAALILLSSLFGLAFSGIGFAVALKTGDAQSTQAVWFLFMPLMFLSPLFAPQESLSGWLETVATYNPMTYLLAGLRSLSVNGWDAGDIGGAVLAVAGIGVVSMTLALLALRSRLR